MRILVVPRWPRHHAVGAYRLWWPAEALRDQGYDVTLHHATRGGGVVNGTDFDVLVMQRPHHEADYRMMRALQAQGVAVVVDMDDDLHAIHPENRANWAPIFASSAEVGRGWVAKCCRHADLVTVSTPALAERYGAHGRVAVLPNCVPAWYLSITVKRPRRVTIGWAGSIDTHPDDLQQAGTAIRDVCRETGAAFHVVGTGKGVADALQLDDPPSTTGWVPFDAYPAKLARLTVGLVPLALTPFNEAKSWLKGLEYASVGVPFVAAPTGPYLELAERGAGWIARTPDEWREHVTRLVTDSTARSRLAESGRQAAQDLTVEQHAWRWHEAWVSAYEQRRGAAA